MTTTLSSLPFNRPYRTAQEAGYLAQALASGAVAGDGPFTARAATLLKRLTGSPNALLTTSCTHALELTALLLDLRPGDEVIMPSFTFVSTANAYALRGAVPVFVDCRPDTLNLDERLVAAAITARTKAIVVVHYGGVAAEMETILRLAAGAGVAVVEDNAHGLGGRYRGRPLGSLGSMATLSFHETKNISCGEGGALLVTDPKLAARAEIIREKGTNRSQFFRGQVDKYRWVDLGSSYLPSDLLAAVLTAQLEEFAVIQRRRRAVWDAYHERLADWAVRHGVAQPAVPEGCEHPAHLYYLVLPRPADQLGLIGHLRDVGITATFHYQPLHNAPAGHRYGRTGPNGCPVTDDLAGRLVRLPLFAGLDDAGVERVVDAVTGYRPGR